jgi:uncharacterized delta-60 repeat protein
LAAAGALDHSFSGDGKRTFGFANGPNVDAASDTAIQADGKVLMVGVSVHGVNDYDFAVSRLIPNGTLDHSFSGDGRRTFGFANGSDEDRSRGVAIRGGKIVVVGRSVQSATGYDFAVARLNSDGSLDHSFSGDGKRTFGFANGTDTDDAYDVSIQSDGRIVVAGESNVGPAEKVAVARLNPSGTLDHSFSGDGRKRFAFPGATGNDDVGFATALQGGRIVVAGFSTQNATGDDVAVARLKSNGGFDQSFSADGRRTFGFANGADGDYANGVAPTPNGKIVLAGSSIQGGTTSEFAVARLNPNGTLDHSFSGDGRRTFDFANGAIANEANDVTLQGGGVVIAGFTNQSGVGSDFAIARLKSSGGFDQSFSGDGRRTFGFANGVDTDTANAVAARDGRVVVAGYSTQSGTGDDFAVARLLGG